MIPVIIPAYEPDERMISLLKDLREASVSPVILVNDGSGAEYEALFSQAKELLDDKSCILAHEVNQGKGRALKTAFAYAAETFPDAVGVVTADSDGQHTEACIRKVCDELSAHPDSLVLGVRSFSGEDIPWKSRWGNRITENIFRYLSGVHVTDTQTGLRGIPLSFAKELLQIPGERFEFEMYMLLAAAESYSIREVQIETIYDSRENHQTHFNPVKDSFKIYRILWKRFLKFIFASLSSCVLDLALFAVFCSFFKNRIVPYIAAATILARVLSAIYNYLFNQKVVFQSRRSMTSSGPRYFLLAVIQMLLSAALVTGGCAILPGLPELAVKIVVDTLLFLVSYHIQQKYVFR